MKGLKEYYDSVVMPKCNTGAYLDINPGTPEYKTLQIELLQCSDLDSLIRIKGNTTKKVRVINGSYKAYLALVGNVEQDFILINRNFCKSLSVLPNGDLYGWDGKVLKAGIHDLQGGFFEMVEVDSVEKIVFI